MLCQVAHKVFLLHRGMHGNYIFDLLTCLVLVSVIVVEVASATVHCASKASALCCYSSSAMEHGAYHWKS